MSLKTDLVAFLLGESAITDVFGTRVYSQFAPTSSGKPYITIQRLDSPGTYHMDGESGIAKPFFQIDVWAADSASAETGAEALRNVLGGYRGTMGSTDIRRAFLYNQRDDFIPNDDGSQGGTFRISMDFTIWYFRAVPTG